MITFDDFDRLATVVCRPEVPGVDRTMLFLSAESSQFVRFNHARVRQSTHVDQCHAAITVTRGKQRLVSHITLGNDWADNARALGIERDRLTQHLDAVPDDPHLLLPDQITSTSRDESSGAIVAHDELIDAITNAAHGTDMVGFYAGGPIIRAFGDSRGQRNWHRVHSFHLDWSLYLDTPDGSDRAVKTSYAGQIWDQHLFDARMTQARNRLEPLAREPITIEPGNYRAFLTPAAMSEILGGLAWSGFSRKERETRTSSLGMLGRREATMHDSVNMREATASGTAPAFTDLGFVLPDSVELIRQGQSVESLVSPRSAAEFEESANANSSEYPASLVMDGADLPTSEALNALDTGIWISNLWYLNYSDRPACRMTGMTRFATFWVENGKLIAPLKVMRFDDSIIRLFGESLEALTREVEFIPDPSTWGQRHLNSMTAPGALVRDMRFTL